ncbi:anthranilate synthase component II [Corynebacterium breve]|uniref:anthranilate synthase n=1 Tax=Corynebacterium breve TaxID=3049799 RepID=A0ABY8VDC9_9CORY|nr:anthranilate synthase component II [Corynebacterium breve]WIM67665.1 anthranilate synthase component II [Corynebacterium breve]
MSRIVLLDNQDSFVYNLVDALHGYDYTVFRNSVSVETVLAADPSLIILSPGPGYPRDSGCMMDLIATAIQRRIPILGICLGFQALIEHFGGKVRPCGPVHGTSEAMMLTDDGVSHPVFADLAVDTGPETPEIVGRAVPVARYHSLGATDVPAGMRSLATIESEIGPVVMAAETTDGNAIGLQFHPESVLTPQGPVILNRCVDQLLNVLKKG